MYAQQLRRPKHEQKETARLQPFGWVNAQTAPLVLNSFRNRSLANQTHDHRDWAERVAKKQRFTLMCPIHGNI
jgi:hypothetical protein